MYTTRFAQADSNQRVALFLLLAFALILAWLRYRNERHAYRFAVAGVVLIAAVAGYNAPLGQGAVMFVVVLIGRTAAAYMIWLFSGFVLAAAKVEPKNTSKILTSNWTGYIAPLLEDIISHDGLQALRTAAVIVRRSDNGVGVTWSRDRSLATIPPDPDMLAYCYVKDAQEFDQTLNSLEAAFARGQTQEPDRRIFVDFLARCVAIRLEDTVHGHGHANA